MTKRTMRRHILQARLGRVLREIERFKGRVAATERAATPAEKRAATLARRALARREREFDSLLGYEVR